MEMGKNKKGVEEKRKNGKRWEAGKGGKRGGKGVREKWKGENKTKKRENWQCNAYVYSPCLPACLLLLLLPHFSSGVFLMLERS